MLHISAVQPLATEFWTLSAESGWNDEARQRAVLNALSETLKDETASRDEPKSLYDQSAPTSTPH